jgi:hypothetical protein
MGDAGALDQEGNDNESQPASHCQSLDQPGQPVETGAGPDFGPEDWSRSSTEDLSDVSIRIVGPS